MRSQHTSGKSYAPKGKTPLLEKSGNWFYLNLLTAMSNQGHLVFMVVSGNVNMSTYLLFLSKVLRSLQQKVFLITDSHPVHLGKRVGEWLAARHKRIEVYYLPHYSPELNPVEYFNQDVKNNVAGKRRAADKEELKEAVETFVKRKKKCPEKVKKYFHAATVLFAAEPN